MPLNQFLGTVVLASALVTGTAWAQSEANGPAEPPPAGFSGSQFIDSKGCVFVRAGLNGGVAWVPRVDVNRQPLCGYKPTVASAAPAAAVAASAVVPAKRTVSTPVRKAPGAQPVVGQRRAIRTGIPAGLRAAWQDGRLNPLRGPRTALGNAQMNQIWTKSVPMELVSR